MCRGMHIHAAVVMIYNIFNTYKNYDYVYREQYNITITRLAEKKINWHYMSRIALIIIKHFV